MRVHVSRLAALSGLAALILTALPAAAAPAAPAERGAQSDLLASLPAEGLAATVVDGALVRAPRSGQEALTSVRDHRDVGAWLGSIARSALDAAGLEAVGAAVPRLLGAEGSAGEAAEEDGEEVPVVTGSFADVLPAGDLDADGRDDVLIADYDLGAGAVQLRALRGDDGSELWRHPFRADGALAFPTGSDLDGDGIPDLLGLALEVHTEDFTSSEDSGLLDSGYEERFTSTYTWWIQVVSGADGSVRWAHSQQGAVDERYERYSDSFGEHERYALESTNLGFFPVPLGAGEVALQGIDLDVADRYGRDGTFLAGSDEREVAVRSATRFDVRDGRDGGHLRATTVGPGPALAFLSALPDGSGDLLLERTLIGDERDACTYVAVVADCSSETGEIGMEVARLDGATFAPRWGRISDAWWGYAESVEADLTGSGTEDLVLLEVSEDGYRTTLLDGVDGTPAWSHLDAGDWRQPLATGALGGARATDLLTGSVEWGEDLTLRLDRLEGATGELLTSSRYVVEMPGSEEPQPADIAEGLLDWVLGEGEDDGGWTVTFLSVYAYGLPDIDGDGFIDVGMGSSTSTWSYPSSDSDEDRWDVRVESGATAAALHAEGGDGYGFLLPLADVTGDGVPEGRRVVRPSRWWEAEEAEAPPQQVLSLQTFTALWDASPWGWLIDGGDQDGVAGSELLHLDDEWDEDQVSSTIRSLEGRTGAVRWTVGSETQG